MFTENALKFIEPARARAELWRLPVTIVLILIVWFVFTFLVTGLGAGSLGVVVVEQIGQTHLIGSTPQSMIALLLSFSGLFLGVWLSVALVHQRGLFSIFGHGFGRGVRNAVLGAVTVWILFAVGSVFSPLEGAPIPNLEFEVWLRYLPLALPLVFLQITSEEMFLRGYVQQQLMVLSRNRLIWWILPSITFGLLHFDQDVFGSNAWLVVIQTSIIGLVAADITMRTGNLGAAIGIHFANNVMGMTVVGIDEMMSGLALYTAPFSLSDEELVREVLMIEIIASSVLLGIYLWIVTFKMRK